MSSADRQVRTDFRSLDDTLAETNRQVALWILRRRCEQNEKCGSVEPPASLNDSQAMAAILTTRKEIDLWMTAPAEEALMLQRPLVDDALMIVARGGNKDEGGLAA